MDYRLAVARLAKPLERIERLRWLFDNLGLDSQYEDWFRHRAWVRTVHGTTRIEGNSLSDLEVEEVLEKSPKFRQKDVLEVLATREALAFADSVAFLVHLPNRRSFSPDAAFHAGPIDRKFVEGRA